MVHKLTSGWVGPSSSRSLARAECHYDQLVAIYGGHTDSTSTVAALPAGAADADLDTKDKWGKSVKKSKDGRLEVFERDLGDGNAVITFVTWADPH